jgi:hypothetical protein
LQLFASHISVRAEADHALSEPENDHYADSPSVSELSVRDKASREKP